MATPEISCNDCPAACCEKGQTLTLSDPEATILREGGTLLNQKGIPHKYKHWFKVEVKDDAELILQHYGNYIFTKRCEYVIERDESFVCAIHDDERRPQVCRDFEVGGVGCRYIRIFGIMHKKTLIEYLRNILHLNSVAH